VRPSPPAWLWWTLPIACAVLAYGAAIAGVFVYDDHHSVRENEALSTLANIPRYFVDPDLFSALDNRMYRPVLLCTFALNHALSGTSPWSYKATNVLLHALTALLLCTLGRRLGATRGVASAAACLFAAHPLASEAINMVSGRSEVLMVCALLAGLHCHISAMRGRRLAAFGTAACAAVACGSKETGVMLPALCCVLEVVAGPRVEKRWRGALVRILPALLLVAGYLIVRRAVLGTATVSVPRLSGGLDPYTGAGRDLTTQLCTMAAALPGVLGQSALPLGLTVDPALEVVRSALDWRVSSGALLLAALTWAGVRAAWRRAPVGAGTAFAWATALPWIVIPLNVPLCEHRYYGPLAGLALVLAGGLPGAALAVRWRVALVAAVAVAFACGSAERSLCYRDEKVLWERAYRDHPQSYRACYGQGVCLMQEGRLEEARAWMERALAIYPEYFSASKNLVELHLQLRDRGDPRAALAIARQLAQRAPRDPFVLLLHSRALAAVGVLTGEDRWFDDAVAAALRVLEVAPAKGLVYRTAAHARRLQGRAAEALALLDAGIARGLDHVSVLMDRYDVLRELGRGAEARAVLHRALQQAPWDERVQAAVFASRPHAAPHR
jgi:tetratricopeptide (TPR) repeat protein